MSKHFMLLCELLGACLLTAIPFSSNLLLTDETDLPNTQMKVVHEVYKVGFYY